MTHEKDTGSDFRYRFSTRPGEETGWCWYKWNEEEKDWEFYGHEQPSWDELSEWSKDNCFLTTDEMAVVA